MVTKMHSYCKILGILVCLCAAYFVLYHHSKSLHISTKAYENVSKLHVVFGILSSAKGRDLRDAQRETWINTALHENLPFKFTYKFLLDSPNDELIKENDEYNDIVFLNAPESGRAVRFGRKLHLWLKYIIDHYPDAHLSAKIDDDVFLCVPQIFDRLYAIKSKTLYYGWGHNKGGKVTMDRRIDEMFVVLGEDLVRRISERPYCENSTSCENRGLVDTNYGGTSLGIWLSVYDDVDFHTDNPLINHGGKKTIDKISPNFCNTHLVCHKSDPVVMRYLDASNRHVTSCRIGSPEAYRRVSGVTGSNFSGDEIRASLTSLHVPDKSLVQPRDVTEDCERFAVVTTIFHPSKAVVDLARNPEWCLVIVADEKTPAQTDFMKDIQNNRVKFLSLDMQNTIFPLLSKIIPINHFGRKNIGYMYAIQHKARYIWDFDDDNIGVVNLTDFQSGVEYSTICDNPKARIKVVNPYPYFEPQDLRVWPRGFPLQQIKNNDTVPKICECPTSTRVGVVQSLANNQPDVDAIYRLTHQMPLYFRATPRSHRPLVLPGGVLAPFNAQATLWLAPAFPYLALPISVHGRVSDIWRAYITQHFLHQAGLQLAFSAPYVEQIRNEHMDIQDFNAELDLYEKSQQLTDLLSSDTISKVNNIADMFDHLYRRGYLQEEDIYFISAWEKTLKAIGDIDKEN